MLLLNVRRFLAGFGTLFSILLGLYIYAFTQFCFVFFYNQATFFRNDRMFLMREDGLNWFNVIRRRLFSRALDLYFRALFQDRFCLTELFNFFQAGLEYDVLYRRTSGAWACNGGRYEWWVDYFRYDQGLGIGGRFRYACSFGAVGPSYNLLKGYFFGVLKSLVFRI